MLKSNTLRNQAGGALRNTLVATALLAVGGSCFLKKSEDSVEAQDPGFSFVMPVPEHAVSKQTPLIPIRDKDTFVKIVLLESWLGSLQDMSESIPPLQRSLRKIKLASLGKQPLDTLMASEAFLNQFESKINRFHNSWLMFAGIIDNLENETSKTPQDQRFSITNSKMVWPMIQVQERFKDLDALLVSKGVSQQGALTDEQLCKKINQEAIDLDKIITALGSLKDNVASAMKMDMSRDAKHIVYTLSDKLTNALVSHGELNQDEINKNNSDTRLATFEHVTFVTITRQATGLNSTNRNDINYNLNVSPLTLEESAVIKTKDLVKELDSQMDSTAAAVIETAIDVLIDFVIQFGPLLA